jgi:hypothetical protein
MKGYYVNLELADPGPNKRPASKLLALGEKLIELRHLPQVSLTIFKSVTRRSPYSSLAAAFSIWPSFSLLSLAPSIRDERNR